MNHNHPGRNTDEAIRETLELLADAEAVQSLKQGIEDAQQGRTVSWKEARPELMKPRRK